MTVLMGIRAAPSAAAAARNRWAGLAPLNSVFAPCPRQAHAPPQHMARRPLAPSRPHLHVSADAFGSSAVVVRCLHGLVLRGSMPPCRAITRAARTQHCFT